MIDSIGELDKQIREELGFSDEDMNHYFLFKEQGEQFMVQERRWLPPTLGGLKLKRLMDRLGAKREEHNGKALFTIEKGREVGVPTPLAAPLEHLESPAGPQPVTTKNNSKNNYDLKTSVQILPMLKAAFPIVKDQNGVVIDGFHRLGVDKEWNTVTVQIENENQRKIARFVANFCRRDIAEKEKRDFVTGLHLETGWTPKEMAEHTPMSYSWIMKYLPDKYKDKEMAELGKKGAKVKAEVDKHLATRHIAEEPILRRCGFSTIEGYDHGTYDPKFVEGIPLCNHHHELVKNDPSLLKKLKEKPSPPQRTEKHEYKPQETAEHRLAVMHPTESKMELEVIQELQAEGWPIDTEYWIPLTKPDGFLHNIRLPLELDGEQVHRGKKAEWDEIVNSILRHRGMEPVRERFSHYSVKRKEEIKASFRERMIQGYREKGLKLPLKVQEIVGAVKGAH